MRTLSGTLFLGAVLAGAVLLYPAGSFPGNSTPAVAHAEMRLADLPFATAADDDCGICGSCPLAGGAVGHSAASAAGGHTRGDGWHTTCLADTCGCKHRWTCECYCAESEDPEGCREQNCNAWIEGCDENEEENALQQLWNDVLDGTLDPAQAAARYKNVEFNRERGALQVMGCSDEVVAHIPLRLPAVP